MTGCPVCWLCQMAAVSARSRRSSRTARLPGCPDRYPPCLQVWRRMERRHGARDHADGFRRTRRARNQAARIAARRSWVPGPARPALDLVQSCADCIDSTPACPARAPRGENIPPPVASGRPGLGQCASRCMTRARAARPRVSLSARIAPLAAMVISQPRRVLGRRMCLWPAQRPVVRSVTTCLHVRCGMAERRALGARPCPGLRPGRQAVRRPGRSVTGRPARSSRGAGR
jgi:hypothetical protein